VDLRLSLPFARAIHLRAFEPSLAVFQLAFASDSIAVRLTHLHLLRMISILAASVSTYPVLVSHGLMVPPTPPNSPVMRTTCFRLWLDE
jgi:hypothetical protein